jgi:hypothetical protein
LVIAVTARRAQPRNQPRLLSSAIWRPQTYELPPRVELARSQIVYERPVFARSRQPESTFRVRSASRSRGYLSSWLVGCLGIWGRSGTLNADHFAPTTPPAAFRGRPMSWRPFGRSLGEKLMRTRLDHRGWDHQFSQKNGTVPHPMIINQIRSLDVVHHQSSPRAVNSFSVWCGLLRGYRIENIRVIQRG